MRTEFILVYLTFVTLKGTYGTYGYVDGWMPVPNEEIFRRLNSNNIQNTDNAIQTNSSWHRTVELTTENPDAIRYQAIKLVEPQKIHGKFTAKRFGLPTKFNNTKDDTRIELSTVKNVRKAKKIEERHLIVDSNNSLVTDLFLESTEDYDKLKPIKEASTDEDNIDAVTESSASTHHILNRIKSKPGYVYSAPVKPEQSQSNYTKTFLNILGKYNINSEDKLTNYAKSRISNHQPLQNQQIIYLPIPIRYSQRYNSLNHLPIDPLLAVFLSNYGHYLPYSYGIHNSYRNLYGYLASNNIHNNKPFGPYKIFSDTDSSN